MQKLTNEDDFSTALATKKFCVVDFSAKWCGPCNKLTPVLDRLSEKYKDALFLKVDVDTFSDLAEKYKVSALPTVIIFKDTVQLDKTISGFSSATIREIEDILSS